MIKRIGKYTIKFLDEPLISSYSSVVGKLEGEGPLKEGFDKIIYDSHAMKNTFEEAESHFQQEAVSLALSKWGGKAEDADFIFAGDLLNQCMASSFGVKAFNIPFLGQYGACSTSAQSLIMAAAFIESKAAKVALAVTSSHFCSAERQFRFPLEYGGVRTPTAQRTVTGAGAFVLESAENPAKSVKSPLLCPKISMATVGKIVDLGVTDANNMGAAMAPAAADTLKTFFDDTGKSPTDYDMIFTGDLGKVGSKLLYELMNEKGYNIKENHKDCGLMIYDMNTQDVHAGGSGCGCGACTLSAHILPKLSTGEYQKVLYMATGALMSSTSSTQGATIPSVAHLVELKGAKG
ncbi:MAG: stage V sporulation protein AD [Ruminococcus sp.]|nr:stage V sporulation protein AD [Ruminococcus sp.]